MNTKLVSVILRVSVVIALLGIAGISAVADGPGQVPFPPGGTVVQTVGR